VIPEQGLTACVFSGPPLKLGVLSTYDARLHEEGRYTVWRLGLAMSSPFVAGSSSPLIWSRFSSELRIYYPGFVKSLQTFPPLTSQEGGMYFDISRIVLHDPLLLYPFPLS